MTTIHSILCRYTSKLCHKNDNFIFNRPKLLYYVSKMKIIITFNSTKNYVTKKKMKTTYSTNLPYTEKCQTL